MRDGYSTSAEISVHSFKSMKSMLSVIYETDLYFIREKERERERELIGFYAQSEENSF